MMQVPPSARRSLRSASHWHARGVDVLEARCLLAGISSISPVSAAAGSTVALTVNLSNGATPPVPPANMLPTSIKLGTLSGTGLAHPSQYVVTGNFAIPANESAGTKDVTVTFSTPNGTVTYSLAGGFTVTSVGPEIQVLSGTADIANGGSLSFGGALVGAPTTQTFTVKNLGSSNLTLSNPISVPSGFTVTSSFGATTLAAGASTTFTVRMDAAAAGTYGGTLSFANNDSDENPFNFTLSGTVTQAGVTPHPYTVVDTGQVKFYNASAETSAPSAGQTFYGQDAQYTSYPLSYAKSADGLSVYDLNTGLTWMQSPDTNRDGSLTYSDKLTYAHAVALPATFNTANYGGYSDWRLPTIKELYSLINFNGEDVNPMASTGATPFIDTSAFGFAYGFTANGERIIDSQWATSTLYTANSTMMFGVNFADGRIKGYPVTGKVFHVLLVRGNTSYGINSFASNGDGTVTDTATGLMWSQSDSGSGMNWQDALAWVQTKNSQNYLGHNDWRLPNAKEMQSIVDYTRSPDTTISAAINPVFNATQITGENGQADYPWYWTGTTHAAAGGSGTEADYIPFGRAWGYMNGQWIDIHGAGSQRGDPKSGSLSSYTYTNYGYYNSNAPQGDAIRIFNYVRLVRDAGSAAPADSTAPTVSSSSINAGATQRSMVTQLGVVFSEPVTVNPGAVTVLLSSGLAISNTTITVSNPSADQKTYLLTFSGSGAVGGSLADGVYDLKITATGVRDLAGNPLSGDYTQRFHRLFGDANGDRKVNMVDYTRLRLTLGKSSGNALFNSAFDYDGNGTINTIDLSQFRRRFGQIVTY